VVYAGFAPQNAAEVLAAIMREIARLRDEPVADRELERVRDFAKGRLELRLEDTRGVSAWLAGQELFLGRVRTVEEVSAIIDGIGPADIQRVAREYLRPELAYVAAIGPRAALAAIAPSLRDRTRSQWSVRWSARHVRTRPPRDRSAATTRSSGCAISCTRATLLRRPLPRSRSGSPRASFHTPATSTVGCPRTRRPPRHPVRSS